MCPTISIAGLQISSYALAYAIAGAVGSLYAFHRLLRLYTPRHVTTVFLIAGLIAIAGTAGLHRIVESVATAVVPGAPAELPHGGTIMGFITFGGLAVLVYLLVRRLPIGESFDTGIPGLPLGQAIGRIGCLLAGCCAGRPTDSFLAMSLPGQDDRWLPRYPTQLISSAGDFGILATLLLVERRAERGGGLPFPGFLTLLYGVLYFSKRFLVEFLREQLIPFPPPFTWAQWLSLMGLAGAAALMVGNLARARRARS